MSKNIKVNDSKNKTNIIDNVLKFLLKYKIIILSSVVFIFIVILGIIVYQIIIVSADAKMNVEFEKATSTYKFSKNSTLYDETQKTQVVLDVANKLKSVVENAKSKKLKLRASYALGSLYYDIKNYDEAKKHFEDVASKKNFYLSEPSMFNLASTYIALKEYNEASELLNTLIKVYPNSYLVPEATLTLSDIYILQGKKDLALDTLLTWLNNNEDDDSQYKSLFTQTMILIKNNIY